MKSFLLCGNSTKRYLVDIAKNEGIRHVLSSHPNMMAAAAPESYPWTDKAENLFPAAPGNLSCFDLLSPSTATHSHRLNGVDRENRPYGSPADRKIRERSVPGYSARTCQSTDAGGPFFLNPLKAKMWPLQRSMPRGSPARSNI